MAGDAAKTLVAAEGTLYVGPTTATAPTDADSTPDSDFVDVGGFFRDNLGLTPGREENDFRFFGSFFPDRTIVTARTMQFTVTLGEFDGEAMLLAFDGGEITGGPTEWTYTPPDPRNINEKSLILDLFDDIKIHRWYLPRVKVSDVGQIVFQNEDVTGFPLTFSVLNPGDDDPAFQFFASDAGFSAT